MRATGTVRVGRCDYVRAFAPHEAADCLLRMRAWLQRWEKRRPSEARLRVEDDSGARSEWVAKLDPK